MEENNKNSKNEQKINSEVNENKEPKYTALPKVNTTVNNKSGNEFRAVNYKERKTNKNGFGRTVVVPFLSGVLGAGIIIGTCFGIPEVKSAILGNNNTQTGISSSNSNNISNIQTINPTQISLQEYSETGIAVSKKILPSIVGITVEYPVNSIFAKSSTTTTASGSGIIISEDGYILTNNHVINTSSTSSYYEIGEASKVEVYLYNEDEPYTATVIGTDEETDLAVIKIDKTGLTAAELGNSDNVQIGEVVMAVGNPLGMQSSVTSGIVSAVNREVTDSDGKKYKLIQTDAAINSGNSGGALVNTQGQVIGINTLKVSATGVEGMGFAIPVNSAVPIYEQLIQYNKVKRPYIGIGGRDLDASTAQKYNLVEGIYIVSVEEYSAAEKAGIKIGDVIVKADGQSIKTMDELNSIKNTHEIGDTMTITINRNGKEKDLSIVLQEQ